MKTTEDMGKVIRLYLDYLWNPVEGIYDIAVTVFEIPVDCSLIEVFSHWILLPTRNKLRYLQLLRAFHLIIVEPSHKAFIL
jgi:hypothetical protein